MKKSSKKSQIKTTKPKIVKEQPQQQQEQVLPASMPTIPPGMVNIAISEIDLTTFVNLMSICAQTFEQLAKTAAQDNDQNSFGILQARFQLSSAFARKLAECTRIPEPVSRDLH